MNRKFLWPILALVSLSSGSTLWAKEECRFDVCGPSNLTSCFDSCKTKIESHRIQLSSVNISNEIENLRKTESNLEDAYGKQPWQERFRGMFVDTPSVKGRNELKVAIKKKLTVLRALEEAFKSKIVAEASQSIPSVISENNPSVETKGSEYQSVIDANYALTKQVNELKGEVLSKNGELSRAIDDRNNFKNDYDALYAKFNSLQDTLSKILLVSAEELKAISVERDELKDELETVSAKLATLLGNSAEEADRNMCMLHNADIAEDEEIDDLTKSFTVVRSEDSGNDALVNYVIKADNSVDHTFDEVLSEANYDAILKLNDLSYARAKLLTVKQAKKLDVVKKRNSDLGEELQRMGWSNAINIEGKTGKDNRDDDITAIISHNGNGLIVVAFHGSRNGSFWGDGDWGANFDYTAVPANTILKNVEPLPDTIKVYRGYANNLESAKDNIFAELKKLVSKFDNPWVILTGHSKGAGMATLYAPFLKTAFTKLNRNLRLGVLAFSSPRVFGDDATRDWVHNIVGKRNIMRVNAHGDLVTIFPPRQYGYRSVGVLVLDSKSNIDKRMVDRGRTLPDWRFDPKGWGGTYHYGFKRDKDAGIGFDPEIVPKYSELQLLLKKGFSYQNDELSHSTLR